MKETITERIQELVSEINSLLKTREDYVAEINKIVDQVKSKQGAIYELKQLLEAEETTAEETTEEETTEETEAKA